MASKLSVSEKLRRHILLSKGDLGGWRGGGEAIKEPKRVKVSHRERYKFKLQPKRYDKVTVRPDEAHQVGPTLTTTVNGRRRVNKSRRRNKREYLGTIIALEKGPKGRLNLRVFIGVRPDTDVQGTDLIVSADYDGIQFVSRGSAAPKREDNKPIIAQEIAPIRRKRIITETPGMKVYLWQ